MLKFSKPAILLALFFTQGCAVDTSSYYQETGGEISVSTSSLEAA